MAIINNIASRFIGLGFLAILSFGVFSGAAEASENASEAAARKAARVREAEQTLADLGYWVLKVDGASDDSTRQAIMAFQKVEGLKRTGVLDDQVLRAIRLATRPAAKFGGPTHVEIDIARQVIFLVNDAGEVTNVLSTSTGNGERYQSEGKWHTAVTPKGSFKIQRQIKGVRNAPLGTIYHPSYFNGGVAIHGSNSVPAHAASHGCARIPRFAEKQFSDMVHVGMPVFVY